MYEREDVGCGGEFGEGGDDGVVGGQVAFCVGRGRGEGAGFNVKDVDEDADAGEDVGLLGREVVFCEGILSVHNQHSALAVRDKLGLMRRV